VKLSISCEWGAATIPNFELKRDVDLAEQIDTICKELKAPEPSTSYALFVEVDSTYLKPEHLTGKLLEGTSLRVQLTPELAANDSVQKLKSTDPETKKKALTGMKTRLKDKEFAKCFLENEGGAVMVSYMQDLSGNVLAFAMSTLESLLAHHVGFDKAFDKSFLKNILPFVFLPNQTASRRVVEILTHLLKAGQHDFTAIDEAIQADAAKDGKRPYWVFVQLLSSVDLNVKLSSLTFICELINSASDEPKKRFFHLLDDLGINRVLKDQINTIQSQEFKELLYIYQRARLWELRHLSDTTYDKNNEQHEKMLLKLWKLLFPDTPLENRVSKQWKMLGFQGTDPATDFRGMGLLGLRNLLYMAENYNDKLRKIISDQTQRNEHEYPVAVAGINVSQMLFELLHVGAESPAKPLFNILFDNPNAFEEMYCVALQVLDLTWVQMNASYMEFRNVINSVRKIISEVLAHNPASIDVFHRFTLLKQSGGSEGNIIAGIDDIECDPLDKIQDKVKKNMADLVKNQKLAYLRDGCAFKTYGQKQKGNKAAPQYIYIRLHDNINVLEWTNINNLNDKPHELPNKVQKSEFKGVMVGLECPVFQKRKLKPEEEEIVPLTFALTLASGEPLTLISQNQTDFVNWTDGLRGWIGLNMECPETLDDIKTLVDTKIEVEMLDLEGVIIPSSVPPVPSPPANFDFFHDTKKEQLAPQTRKGIALGRSRLTND